MSIATPSPFERDHRILRRRLRYTQGLSLQAWQADAIRVDATLRKPSLIGEAATRVPEDIRAQAPAIPWRKIVGLRNRLMHAYPATDDSAIWTIVVNDVPALQLALEALLDRLPPAARV